jgi:tetratricopeptide (TPR) repeat protein
MSSSRIIAILLVAALVSVVALKVARMHHPEQTSQLDATRGERVRRFWETYNQASQKRAAGDLEAAIALYETALELKPDHEDSLYYSGNCYFELARYDEATAANQRLIAVNSMGSSRGYMQLALIYACLEPGAPVDLKKARGFFQQALQLDPDSGAMLGIGEVALLEGKWQEAYQAFEKDNADNDMSVATPYLLGYLCWRRSQREEAWRWFRLGVQRGELKKPAVKWTEEGDVKADPELRWRALARQSVFGKHWIRLREYLKNPDFSPSDMEREYRLLGRALVPKASVQKRPQG